jgi:hypothetical protein
MQLSYTFLERMRISNVSQAFSGDDMLSNNWRLSAFSYLNMMKYPPPTKGNKQALTARWRSLLPSYVCITQVQAPL